MSELFKKILKRIPLHKRVLHCMIYNEYNWDDNGKFLGKIDVINEEAAEMIELILKWVEDGMPGIDKAKEFIKNKDYKLEQLEDDDEKEYFDDEDYEKDYLKYKK